MRKSTLTVTVGTLLTTIVALPQAGAQGSSKFDCDLHLAAAAGVPHGDVHKYEIRGLCRENSGVVSNKTVREVWVVANARYDVKTAAYQEQIVATGWGAPAKTVINAKCGDDPMITNAKCTAQFIAPANPWPDFVTFWKLGRHLTKENVTYAKAAELSKSAASVAKTPPPPPPAPKPKPTTPKNALKGAADAVKTAKDDSVPPIKTIPTKPLVAQTEIPLAEGTRIYLESGNSLQAITLEGELRWMIVGPNGEVLRTYPSGSRAYKTAAGEILVNYGAGVQNLGKAKAPRLRLPRR